ncbi:MAG: DNA polymerase I [Oscillospiraceae bacterium]|jgi:DNA polymerase-1|nr:DNA polymerase I [Oscillospiraceae bacterium]
MFLIIDGNSLANRSYYGIRPLTNKNGVYTHSVTGFMNTLLKLEGLFKPDKVAVAFDLRAPTFRHKLYDNYKGTRKQMPEELAVQLPYLKEILAAYGIAVIQKEGYEADDILGMLSKLTSDRCVLATGDRDSFQLISERVFVNYAKTGGDVLMTPDIIAEQYGVKPIDLIEVKSLMGDASDNIPGVPGIGEKTALTLIQKYKTIQNIYDNIAAIDVSKSVRDKLISGKDSCFMSRELAVILTENVLGFSANDFVKKPQDTEKLAEILTELEMFRLLERLKLHLVHIEKAAKVEPYAAKVAVPDSVDVSMSFGNIFVYENGKERELDGENAKEFLQNRSPKRTFDVKSICEADFDVNNCVFDTVLAAYLSDVNAKEYSIERLADEYDAVCGEGLSATLKKLNDILWRKLSENGGMKVLTEIEIPLAKVLADMERIGAALDIEGVKKFDEALERDIKTAEQGIYALAGDEFNILSAKQLGEVLFEKLHLPHGKKNKTGYSTNADVLESLEGKHEIIPLIGEYRGLSKLRSTYTHGLLAAAGDNGIIRTKYRQTETRTGRISSAEPNLQNIPVRTERGRQMRAFFVARGDNLLCDADYSQIELRVLAHMANDKAMIEIFSSGGDIHTATAAQVFNQPAEWVTPEMRRAAKAVNFGIVYGISGFSLAKDIGVSVKEGQKYIEGYLSRFSGVAEFMEKSVADAKRLGYAETLLGRRRILAEINSSNKNIAAAAARMAMNTPVQGTAADIIKLAMVRVHAALKDGGFKAKLILQIHDELIVETPQSELDDVKILLKREMENAVKLLVPLTADVGTGKTWLEAH